MLVLWKLTALLNTSKSRVGEVLVGGEPSPSTEVAPFDSALDLMHTPYFKMAANKLFFCLHVNYPSSTCIKKQKNFEVKMRRRGLINMQAKE